MAPAQSRTSTEAASRKEGGGREQAKNDGQQEQTAGGSYDDGHKMKTAGKTQLLARAANIQSTKEHKR